MAHEEQARLRDEPCTPTTFTEIGLPHFDNDRDILETMYGLPFPVSMTRNAGRLNLVFKCGCTHVLQGGKTWFDSFNWLACETHEPHRPFFQSMLDMDRMAQHTWKEFNALHRETT